jgi:transposase
LWHKKQDRAVSDASAVSSASGQSAADFHIKPLVAQRGAGARNGSKHHLLVDATGIPLAWTVTGGNRHDVTQLIPLLERVPPARGKVGRPRRRPDRVTADRGYDHDKYRRQLRARGIKHEIARRKTAHGSRLGRARWVVERTFAWLHHFKRLLVRYDRRHEIHEAFLALGCCLVCFRRLQRSL